MNVNLTLAPGTYNTQQLVGWETSDQVRFVCFTVNGRSPILTEYVAYDTLSPPNPFLAVTQDGLGNVVYDGGFPKFYNIYAPAPTDTRFDQLSGSFKFLYNALNFTRNPAKAKKVLILGDRDDGGDINTIQYYIKATNPTGFFTSFSRLCAVAGFTPVFKDRMDYGGKLNPTASELAEYACVILMSSYYGAGTANDLITDAGAIALRQFREQGNGLIVITDHGDDIPNIDEAAIVGKYSGFFRTANKVIVDFGAFFTGLYNRVPVNVGFLRRNYGDHPLYANLLDSESIHAGASESKVVSAQYRKYARNELPIIPMVSGNYYVQILASLANGSLEIQRHMYNIDKSFVSEHGTQRRLYVRKSSTSPWIANFEKGGWHVYKDGNKIRMLPSNTRVWDEEHKKWLPVK